MTTTFRTDDAGRIVGLDWSRPEHGGLPNPPDDPHHTTTLSSPMGAAGQGQL